MKKILIVLILCLTICGCSEENEKLNLETVMKENEYIIVDVRTKEEYDVGHLVEAINIPYDQIDENADLDKNKVILVYCKSGNRSGIAFNILNGLGYTVYDLGAFNEIDLPKE